VYAVGIDELDVRYIDEKGKNDVGKWVPGRSFAGRCMMTGTHEKDIVRGDLVIGIFEIKKVRLQWCRGDSTMLIH